LILVIDTARRSRVYVMVGCLSVCLSVPAFGHCCDEFAAEHCMGRRYQSTTVGAAFPAAIASQLRAAALHLAANVDRFVLTVELMRLNT